MAYEELPTLPVAELFTSKETSTATSTSKAKTFVQRNKTFSGINGNGNSHVNGHVNGHSNGNGTNGNGLDLKAEIERLREELTQLQQVCRDSWASESEMLQQRDESDRECRRLRRVETNLRTQLNQLREDDPRSKTVREILEHWAKACGHETALLPIDGKRADKVRRALGWKFKPARLMEAIDGAAKFPYVVEAQRVAHGPKALRFDDLETILKSEKQIEKLAAMAAMPVPEPETERKDVQPSPRPAAYRVTKFEGDPLDVLLGRLEGVRTKSLNEWTARCPAHEDRNASFWVKRGAKSIIVKCSAGCHLEEIAKAVQMEVSDLCDAGDTGQVFVPEIPPLHLDGKIMEWCEALQSHYRLRQRIQELRGWTAPTLDALDIGYDAVERRLTLPVRDAEDNVVNVLRYLPARKGNEKKLLAMRGRPRDLYPAPETLEIKDNVWIFEGEPDAITAKELGLQATALPGVNGWRVEWAKRFADRCVIVCMDSDDAGRKAAKRIQPSLLQQVREVRVVDLDENRGDGYDLSDYVREGHTAAALMRLANHAAPIVEGGR